MQFHILNGDSLKEQLKNKISGEIIVCKECMIEGNLEGETLDNFFESRASFLNEMYDVSEVEYLKTTKLEFLRLKQIPKDSDINLWFEHDLFCQANFWFIIYLLNQFNIKAPVYFVQPNEENVYNFGSMTDKELQTSYNNRIQIKGHELNEFENLWDCYRKNNTKNMLAIAESLGDSFPFLIPAIQAHIKKTKGEPEQTISSIMADLNTSNFGAVFKEFCKREAIYGFGDLQVKTIYERVINE